MPKPPQTLYYFADGNRRRGPYTLDQMRQFPLRTNTLIWRDGLKVWTELPQVPELWAIFAERLVQPPPEVAAYQVPEPPDPRTAALLATVPQTGFFGDASLGEARETAAVAVERNPLAGVSVVLGLLALPAWCLPWGFAFSGPLAAAGLVCGLLARRRAARPDGGAAGRGMANAGIALGAVSLGVTLVIGGILLFYSATMPAPDRDAPKPTTAVGSGAR